MPDDVHVTPAEAVVLLAPNGENGPAALKAMLLFLLATGVLRIEEIEEPGLIFRRRTACLKVAAIPKNQAPEVAAVLEVVAAAEAEGGKVRDIVKQAKQAFGHGFGKFLGRFVLPSLFARGLLTVKKLPFGLVLYLLTIEGKRARAGIEADLVKAAEVASLLRTDPARAATIARTLSVNVLLSKKLRKEFKPLANAMRGMDSGEIHVADGFVSHSAHGFDFGALDIGGLDFGGLDAGALDAIHSGFDSFDAGFSDGGGHDGGGHH